MSFKWCKRCGRTPEQLIRDAVAERARIGNVKPVGSREISISREGLCQTCGQKQRVETRNKNGVNQRIRKARQTTFSFDTPPITGNAVSP